MAPVSLSVITVVFTLSDGHVFKLVSVSILASGITMFVSMVFVTVVFPVSIKVSLCFVCFFVVN